MKPETGSQNNRPDDGLLKPDHEYPEFLLICGSNRAQIGPGGEVGKMGADQLQRHSELSDPSGNGTHRVQA